MPLILSCSRWAVYGRNATAGNGPNPPIRKLQKIRLSLPELYRHVERGVRGWAEGESPLIAHYAMSRAPGGLEGKGIVCDWSARIDFSGHVHPRCHPTDYSIRLVCVARHRFDSRFVVSQSDRAADRTN